jgi:hypothetical protein
MSAEQRLINAGATLANIAFNLAQRDPGEFTPRDIAALNQARKDWDEASSATRADATEAGQEAAAVQAVGAWQDIATAPKDGTAVLGLWLPMAGDAAFPRCYAIAHFIEGGWCSVDDDEQTFTDPTHWMPLPAAPADSSMGGGER